MAIYKYKGYDAAGIEVSSELVSQNKNTALKTLKNKSINPYFIEMRGEKNTGFLNLGWLLPHFDVGQFFFQLGIMLKSGLPLYTTLGIIMKNYKQRSISNILVLIEKDISEGIKFSDSLSDKCSNIVSEVYLNMIRIAESTGRLADVLLSIASHNEQKKEREGKIISSLTYPFMVAFIGTGIVGFLISYILPKMEKVFISFKMKLPISTVILIQAGSFLKSYGIIIIIITWFLIIFMIKVYNKNIVFRQTIDSLFLRLKLYKKIQVATFTELLAFQLNEGIPLVKALMGCSGVVKNMVFKREIERIAMEVENGKPLSLAIKGSSIFDEMLIAATITGESTGELSNFIERISSFLKKDVDKILDRLTSMAEPLFILILGLAVGFIMLSIMTPLLKLNQMVK
ncbi:MAG: type II secretion system F family protein [Nitrospirae bacterium]|nr:type II secretion system F family protein [Nitrospirota bacterium]